MHPWITIITFVLFFGEVSDKIDFRLALVVLFWSCRHHRVKTNSVAALRSRRIALCRAATSASRPSAGQWRASSGASAAWARWARISRVVHWTHGFECQRAKIFTFPTTRSRLYRSRFHIAIIPWKKASSILRGRRNEKRRHTHVKSEMGKGNKRREN